MLVLFDHGLVFLEVPKTASTAVRRMLEPHAGRPWPEPGFDARHVGVRRYRTQFERPLAEALGRPAETFCVVREPLERLDSWYRYRQRPAIVGLPASTRGMSFADFVEDCLCDDPPPHARVGSQVRFTGFAGGQAAVDHIFDYRRLDLLVGFLAARTGVALQLGRRNVSPLAEGPGEGPSEALSARFRALRPEEVALYDKVRTAGVLRRGAGIVSSSER